MVGDSFENWIKFQSTKEEFKQVLHGDTSSMGFCFNPPKRNLNSLCKKDLTKCKQFQSTKEEFKLFGDAKSRQDFSGFQSTKEEFKPRPALCFKDG